MRKMFTTAAVIAALSIGASPAFAQSTPSTATYQFAVSAFKSAGCQFEASTGGPPSDITLTVNQSQTLTTPPLKCSVAFNNLPVKLRAENGKLVHSSNDASVFADYSVELNGVNGSTTTVLFTETAASTLTTARTSTRQISLTPSNTLVFNLKAKITGDTAATLAGSYYDTVVMTIG